MVARYYSSLGRFMAVDPESASIIPSSPQTWNRYVYASNNPLKYVDRTGRLSVDAQTASKYPNAAKFITAMTARGPSEYRAFQKYGQASKAAVDAAFVPGKGPSIKGSQLTGANGQFTPNVGSKTLEVDEDVLKSFEAGAKGSKTLLESTVKHELTHYFDDQDGKDYAGEEGELFEIDVYGKDIDTLSDGAAYEQGRGGKTSQRSSGRLAPELAAYMDAADQKKKELEAQGKW